MSSDDEESVIYIDLAETEPEGWMHKTRDRKPLSQKDSGEVYMGDREVHSKLLGLYLDRLSEAGYRTGEVDGFDGVMETSLSNGARDAEAINSLLEQ